ncbi:MAG: hypothetical protein V4702_00205 [Patescibacteria group bacterium]
MEPKNEDPNRLRFPEFFLLSALVLVVIGIIVFLFFQVIAGIIIGLLGVIFGLGAKVANDNKLK